MIIADGINMLELSVQVMGGVDTIYPTLIWDQDNVILVDTGYPGVLPLIREAIEQSGAIFEKLNKIIITHQDLDHIGSLPSIVQQAQLPIEVLANALEKPFIEGEKSLLKITPETIEKAVASLPKEVPDQWRQAFKAVLENPPKSPVSRTISDGEELPYCGGIVIINTPGHTPGHICLYHKSSKTLISADALVVVNGQLYGPDPEQSLDIQLARRSLEKLTSYDIDNVICYHGGLFQDNANQRIVELTQGL
ncbi:putative metallo-hydrolase YflN [compost metagenome]